MSRNITNLFLFTFIKFLVNSTIAITRSSQVDSFLVDYDYVIDFIIIGDGKG